MDGIAINRIPGLREEIAKARAKQDARRENAWKNLPVAICGRFKIYPLSVRDYVVLEHFQSPFIFRGVPTIADVSFFLWALSPQCRLWNEQRGWRKSCLPFTRSTEAFLFSRRVLLFFKRHKKEFEPAVKQIFDYIETMFMDAPPSVQKENETGVFFLTHWFDVVQSEYKAHEEAVWRMPLPQLFQRIRAIYQRKGVKLPVFSSVEDKVKQWVQSGISQGRFTYDDLAAGRVKIFENN